MHQIVESLTSLKKVVHSTHYTKDSKGEEPHAYNGDYAGSPTHKPPEYREQRGDDVDYQDGATKLPRWYRRPEGPIRTRNKNEPVFRQGDFEKQYGIAPSKVLDNSAVDALTLPRRVGEHGRQCDPSACSEYHTQKNRHAPELR